MTTSAVDAAFRAYGIACAAAGAFFFALSVANALWLARTARIAPLRSGPKVSVLIPARNEAERIRPCIESLLAQDYSDYDITVLDDDSTDATPEILAEYAALHPGKFRILHAGALEAGWYGKPRAMHRLAAAADGDWLLFTDADTVHSPDSIGRAVALAERYRADFVSGYLRQVFGSPGEAFVVPSIFLLTIVALPLFLIPKTRSPAISHAIGQYVLFRADTYRKIGGYAAVRDQVSEDVRISRLVKKCGGRVLFADLKDAAECRMYGSAGDALTGISKNVFDYFDKKFAILALATIAVPLAFLVPVIAVFWVPGFLVSARPWLAASAALSMGAWALTAADRRLPWFVPLIHPVILVNVLSAAWRAFRIFRSGGGIVWKGRTVR